MKQNRVLVGITGNIGSGKSTVCNIIKNKAFSVISCDEKTEEAYKIAKTQLQLTFGKEIYDGESVDKKKLAQIVFNNNELRKKLNDILHPVILEIIKMEVNRFNGAVFVEVPLLFEAGFQSFFDEIWLVISSKSKIIDRVKLRDDISKEDVEKRINSQISDNEKIEKANVVIRNDSSLDKLEQDVNEEIVKLLTRYS